MAQIAPFSLPSRPEVTVTLREATVEDAMDFADADEGMEEAVTSLFLDRLQDKATWTDPRKWTGEDRRFALYWYWLHTSDEVEIPMTYKCSLCGKEHTQICDMRGLVDEYQPIKGRPERDLEWKGQKVTVRPLDGMALEEIEMKAADFKQKANAHGIGSKEMNLAYVQLRMLKFLLSVQFDNEKDRVDRERTILSMTTNEFAKFSTAVDAALKDMEHGLLSQYKDGKVLILTPAMSCPVEPSKEGVRLSIPFRAHDYIPRV